MSIRTVVVPLDRSPFGEQALPLAVTIARQASAELHLAHVHRPYELVWGHEFPTLQPSVEEELRRREESYLAEVERRVRDLYTPVRSRVLTHLSVAEALLAYVEEAGPGLLVMATHGHGPLTRAWLGSVADAVVRRSSVPVILVRPGDGLFQLEDSAPLGHILVPLDGSLLAEQVLEPATELARLGGAGLTLLRVLPPLSRLGPLPEELPPEDLDEQRRAKAQAYLDTWADGLRRRGLIVQTRVQIHEHPAAGILATAEDLKVDLIALSTHGRGGMARLLTGSVADKVIRGALQPVLVCRPQLQPQLPTQAAAEPMHVS